MEMQCCNLQSIIVGSQIREESMTTEYLIYTDASADIDPEFMKNENIRFVPMRYMVGDEERLCENLEEEVFLKKFSIIFSQSSYKFLYRQIALLL